MSACCPGSLRVASPYTDRVLVVRNAEEESPVLEQHHARDIYISLLSTTPTPPDTILIAALLRRAAESISRLVQINSSKKALTVLLGKGLIGDDFWNQYLEAEKESEAEIREVIEEANSYRQGWGQFILSHAADMVQHNKIKQTISNIDKARADYCQ